MKASFINSMLLAKRVSNGRMYPVKIMIKLHLKMIV